MHSPMKNQQAISVITMVLTASLYLVSYKAALAYALSYEEPAGNLCDHDGIDSNLPHASLSPLKRGHILDKAPNTPDKTSHITRTRGCQFNFSISGKSCQVFQNKPFPGQSSFHESHGEGQLSCRSESSNISLV